MRKIIISIFLLLLLSCQKTGKERILIDDNTSITKINLNENLNLFISDFIKSVNNVNCIYELYIDKKTEDEYFITLVSLSNTSNYFTNHSPINYTVLNDKLIFIYTGLEDFIDSELYDPKIELEGYYSKDNVPYNTISMVIKKDTSYIVKDIGLPFSDINFLPPIHVKD